MKKSLILILPMLIAFSSAPAEAHDLSGRVQQLERDVDRLIQLSSWLEKKVRILRENSDGLPEGTQNASKRGDGSSNEEVNRPPSTRNDEWPKLSDDYDKCMDQGGYEGDCK